jgi:hypothetical protein
MIRSRYLALRARQRRMARKRDGGRGIERVGRRRRRGGAWRFAGSPPDDGKILGRASRETPCAPASADRPPASRASTTATSVRVTSPTSKRSCVSRGAAPAGAHAVLVELDEGLIACRTFHVGRHRAQQHLLLDVDERRAQREHLIPSPRRWPSSVRPKSKSSQSATERVALCCRVAGIRSLIGPVDRCDVGEHGPQRRHRLRHILVRRAQERTVLLEKAADCHRPRSARRSASRPETDGCGNAGDECGDASGAGERAASPAAHQNTKLWWRAKPGRTGAPALKASRQLTRPSTQ